MIKNLIIILILSLPTIGFSQNDVSIGIAYDWEQLDKADQDLIKKSSQKYLLKLADDDIEGFWELCHSKFKESTPFVSFKEMGEIIAGMITDIENVKFIDAKKVVYTSEPTSSKFSTGGSLDKENATYLQFYTLEGIKNQALSIYKIENKPLSKAITIKLGFENGEYKLTSIEINTNSINKKDAKYYSKTANEWAKKESKLPQFIAINMAYRLSYLGRGTSTSLSLNVMDTLQKLQKNTELISEIKKWNINDSIFDIINIDFLETQSDVTPNIIYVSKVELGEESTRKEVGNLFEYFKNKYPDLVKEFGIFMFTAYEEYPAIRTKQYKYFRIIMNDEK
jgi:hypothetical protein